MACVKKRGTFRFGNDEGDDHDAGVSLTQHLGPNERQVVSALVFFVSSVSFPILLFGRWSYMTYHNANFLHSHDSGLPHVLQRSLFMTLASVHVGEQFFAFVVPRLNNIQRYVFLFRLLCFGRNLMQKELAPGVNCSVIDEHGNDHNNLRIRLYIRL